MCTGVAFEYKRQIVTNFFTSPSAILPVISSTGQVTFVKWGKRPTEENCFPLGSCAPLTQIKRGRYDQFLPRPVRLPLRKFYEKNFDGGYKWYELVPSYWVQGLLARDGNEHRVYIVTIIPTVPNAEYAQWPRILCA